MKKYPNRKFDFIGTMVEGRAEGKKGDFIIVFDDLNSQDSDGVSEIPESAFD